MLSAAISAAQAAACPEPPPYDNHRYDEDAAAVSHGYHRQPFDRLKQIALGRPEHYLSIGGELRIRGEFANGLGFEAEAAEDRVVLGRLLIHGDVQLGSSARVFVQFGSHLATGRAGGDGPVDENHVDVAQGFVDVSSKVAGGQATLRGGRQELGYGSARLISVRESPNIRRAFDGGRLIWQAGRRSIDAFYVRPVELRRGAFDDETGDAQELYGVYATFPLAPDASAGVDAYYLGYRRPSARFTQGLGTERRHSVGARLFGERDQLDWDFEAVYQTGSFARADIKAWTIATSTGYTFPGLPWQPRAGLKANIASGDRDPTDRKLGTFNALFPKITYFTEAAIVAPANIVDLHPSLDLSPTPALGVSFGADLLWRHRRSDDFYEPPLSPVDLRGKRNRYVGTQGYVAAEWRTSPHAELKAWYVHHFAGSSVKSAGGRDVDFIAISAAFKY